MNDTTLFAIATAARFQRVRYSRHLVIRGEAGWRRACFGSPALSGAERLEIAPRLAPYIEALAPPARRQHWGKVAQDLRLDSVAAIAPRLIVATSRACGPIRESIAAAIARPDVPAWVKAWATVKPLWTSVGGNVSGTCSIWSAPTRRSRRSRARIPGDPEPSTVIVQIDARYAGDLEVFVAIALHEAAHGALAAGDVACSDLAAESAAWLWGARAAQPERYLTSTAGTCALAARTK